jgi:uridine kinase
MQPVLVGVAGGSASGKTTLVRAVMRHVGPRTATAIDHDRYYRDHPALTLAERARLNYDHPEALETDLLIAHLLALRAGHGVEAPVYDFRTHARRPATARLEPRPLILIEGILVLAVPELRQFFDLKVFVDADDEVRLRRRLARDTRDRGRSVEAVVAQYGDSVRPMHVAFVEPSRKHADVIVSGTIRRDPAVAALLDRIRERLSAPAHSGAPRRAGPAR